MRDLARLAELSHTIDQVAMAMCRDSHDRSSDGRAVELAVVELAAGEREVVAIALSYALRRRELDEASGRPTSDPVNDRAVAALAAAVRRMLHTAD